MQFDSWNYQECIADTNHWENPMSSHEPGSCGDLLSSLDPLRGRKPQALDALLWVGRNLQLGAIASECFWCAPQNLLGLIKVCEWQIRLNYNMFTDIGNTSSTFWRQEMYKFDAVCIWNPHSKHIQEVKWLTRTQNPGIGACARRTWGTMRCQRPKPRICTNGRA